MTSGGLAGWGDAGPGRWVTLYANSGHVHMVVAGPRFDTSGRTGTQTRWQTAPARMSGYAVRDPDGR